MLSSIASALAHTDALTIPSATPIDVASQPVISVSFLTLAAIVVVIVAAAAVLLTVILRKNNKKYLSKDKEA